MTTLPLLTVPTTKPLTLREADYARAAESLKCDEAAIRAVAEVEARGDGFLSDGRLKVLFEGHKFYKYTAGAHAATHPNICHPTPDRKQYATGKSDDERGGKELSRLGLAWSLNPRAALLSASYGRFQVMGFNHKACGFGSVEEYVEAQRPLESAHLAAFVAYVMHVKLDVALREHRWADFARGYNGAGYAANQYDVKMATAHAKHLQAA